MEAPLKQEFKLLEDLRKLVLGQEQILARDFVKGSKEREADQKEASHKEVARSRAGASQKKGKLASWADDFKLKADTSKQLGNQVAGSIADAFEEFVVQVLKGGESLLNALNNLGKALVRSVINAVAIDLFTRAAIYLVIAIALLAGIYTAGSAPQYFIAAAILIVAGVAMKAIEAAFLAKGGLVMRPTLSVLGEAGPEIVIPEDRFKDFGIGGGLEVGRFQANFPNFREGTQAASPHFAALVSRELHAAYQAANA